MKFQYNCIGSNIPENREHLDKLGMKRVGGIIGNIIMVNYGCYMCLTFYGKMGNNFNAAVKCIGNDQLFRAVTAMRNDSDYLQWFTNDKRDEWLLCKKENYQDFVKLNVHVNFYKATLSELEAHLQRV